MNSAAPVLSAALLLAGSMLLLVAAIGLLRFPDLLTRMHAVLKAGTIGAVLSLASLMVAAPELGSVVRLAGACVVLLFAAPAGAFLLSGMLRGTGARPPAGSDRPPGPAASGRRSGDRPQGSVGRSA